MIRWKPRRLSVCSSNRLPQFKVLEVGLDAALLALELAAAHGLTARRVHDARHAAAALIAGVRCVYTYDVSDWQAFEVDGLLIEGPASTVAQMKHV
jgi:predicted nucleic acid-binding protein